MPHFVIARRTLHMSSRYEIPTKTRFAVYCLLSLHSVLLFQLRPLRGETIAVVLLWILVPAHLFWMAFPLIFVSRFYLVNDHSYDANGRLPRYVDPSPPTLYTILLSMTLVHLGHIAIWTRIYLGTPPAVVEDLSAVVQECTLHFAISFWVLSECEYMRAYWHSRLQDWPVNLIALLKSIPLANFDQTFLGSRDCCSYQRQCQYYMLPRDGQTSIGAVCRGLLDLFDIMAFTWMDLVCLLYPVKRFANPGPNGVTFSIANRCFGVFFTPRSDWFILLDIALQRPVRLLNRMLFESAVEGVKRGLDLWRQRGQRGEVNTSDLATSSDVPALYVPRTDSSDLWVNSEEIAWWAVSRQLYETPWND